MNTPVICVENLVCKFGHKDAVQGLNLTVQPGRCYGFFGRNGAGKTTTIKCLLNLLRCQSGRVEVFGVNPTRDDVTVKSRLAYVPDAVSFYPWMRVKDVLAYAASFRKKWNRSIEADLLDRFRLDPKQRTHGLSKGQKTQLALITAVCPEPELLVLDEPTSGLDPIVRREFLESVIGSYQDAAPENRTILVSTHLITEFEGLIDEFTIIDQGKDVLTMEADTARKEFQRLRIRFPGTTPNLDLPGILGQKTQGREVELLVHNPEGEVMDRLNALSPEEITSEALTLEEIFVAAGR